MKRVFEILALIGLSIIFILSFIIPSNPFEIFKGINFDYPYFLMYFVGFGALYGIVLYSLYSLLDLVVSRHSNKMVVSTDMVERYIQTTDEYVKQIEKENDELKERIQEEEEEEDESKYTYISYFDLLKLMKDNKMPEEVELIMNKKAVKYKLFEERTYYIIKNDYDKSSVFDTFLRDSLTDMESFKKNIRYIKDKN